MNNESISQVLVKTKEFIGSLIFKLREGERIWFSYDKEGRSDYGQGVDKVVEGDEFVYKIYDNNSGKHYLESDEEIEEYSEGISKNPHLNYYFTGEVFGPEGQPYKKKPYEGDPDHDIGDYERFGPDPIRWQDVTEKKKVGTKYVKQELLENLIRVCVREILDQVNDRYENDPEKIDPAKDTPPVVPPSPMTANVDEELKKVVKKMVSEFLKKL